MKKIADAFEVDEEIERYIRIWCWKYQTITNYETKEMIHAQDWFVDLRIIPGIIEKFSENNNIYVAIKRSFD